MESNKLNMRQMREVQKALGLSADEFAQDQFGLMAAMAWQVKKAQGDKDFTFEQALDLTADEINEIIGEPESPLAE